MYLHSYQPTFMISFSLSPSWSICLAFIFWDVVPSTDTWSVYQRLNSWRKLFSLSKPLWFTNSSLARIFCSHLPFPWWNFVGTELAQVHAIVTTVSSYAQLSCCVPKTVSLKSSAASDSYVLCAPPPQRSLKLGSKQCAIDAPFRVSNPKLEFWASKSRSSSLYFKHLLTEPPF